MVFLLLEDCPALPSRFQAEKYFSCVAVRKSTIKYLHLALATQRFFAEFRETRCHAFPPGASSFWLQRPDRQGQTEVQGNALHAKLEGSSPKARKSWRRLS